MDEILISPRICDEGALDKNEMKMNKPFDTCEKTCVSSLMLKPTLINVVYPS